MNNLILIGMMGCGKSTVGRLAAEQLGLAFADTDERIVKMLRASGKPVTLAVNKVDDGASEYLTAEFWKLGMGEPYGISAMHGRGVGDLLDAERYAVREHATRSES